ncbi:hypothetical protein [Sphingomonas bacterium]|uniref:hypothetical protein n=1 Tax=Sphingomonas bacterium TaxID=1895847 RepID=UPI001576F51D|nr:hypothetical protein [Sphingomonas bacterium]
MALLAQVILFGGLMGLGTVAAATETIIYTYDAKGRVIQVVHSGTVNNNLQTTYQHDHADNRVHVAMTGGSN